MKTLHALTLLVVALVGLSGCVGHNVINPVVDGERGFSNPNSDPIPPLMIESIRWVVTRYPPEESAEWSAGGAPLPDSGAGIAGPRFAINLPEGVNALVYQRVADLVGFGAVPMQEGNESLPTYHIARIWVQGDEARIDVIRPIKGLNAGPESRPITQPITVRLRGGLKPWHVTSHNVWSFNSLPTPPLNYMSVE
jgi:hypothetical protein